MTIFAYANIWLLDGRRNDEGPAITPSSTRNEVVMESLAVSNIYIFAIMTLEYGKYYHIYNRGNNSEVVFRDEKDYTHFIELFLKFLLPAFDLYAYCLMNNHFHFCVQVKEKHLIPYIDTRYRNSMKNKWKMHQENEIEEKYRKRINPTSMIGILFNSYVRWFNIKYSRTGSLFEKSFERKLIEDEDHLLNEIVYINANAVKHKIVEKPEQYEWSSYNEVISGLGNIVERQFLIEKFGDIDNFTFVHENKVFE